MPEERKRLRYSPGVRRRTRVKARDRTSALPKHYGRVYALAEPEAGALRRSRRSEPGGDRAKRRKFPHAVVFGVDQLDPIRPRSDVEAAWLTEVEQHRPGIVEQGEYPQRAVVGDQVEIGHAASEQRMSLAEIGHAASE